jgi:hypothetical protein
MDDYIYPSFYLAWMREEGELFGILMYDMKGWMERKEGVKIIKVEL